MAIFGVPLAFGSAVAPSRQPAWRVAAGVELSYLPNVDPAIGRPTICRPDKPGPENTDLLFAAPRPRIWLSLPAGLAVEASWIPPLQLAEVTANLVGIAVSRTTALNRKGAILELRAHATFGVITAPITCNDAALQNSDSPCYQGMRSHDAFHPNILGLAATLSWSLGRLRPYMGAGYNHLAPRFQVNFTNRIGTVDRRRVIVDLDRGVLYGGVTWSPVRVLDVGGEVYSAPVDAVTARVTARVRFGKK